MRWPARIASTRFLLGEVAIEIVGIDPFPLVTFRIFGADENVVAGLRSQISGGVIVRDNNNRLVQTRDLGGAGTCATSWRSARVLIFIPLSTPAIWLILNEWGPPTFHYHGCADNVAVGKTNSTYAAVLFADLFNLPIESELGSASFRRAMQIVSCELRVGDVAAGRGKRWRRSESRRWARQSPDARDVLPGRNT